MARKAQTAFLFFLLSFAFNSYGQEWEFFITFNDKLNSKYSIQKPEQFLSYRSIARRQNQRISITEKDLPVSTAYLDSLRKKNIKVLNTSRWLNGALIMSDSATVSSLSFAGIDNIRGRKGKTTQQPSSSRTQSLESNDSLYGSSHAQVAMLSGDIMHKNGLNGASKLIAVIDGGFKNLDKISHFDNLTKKGKIVATKDFVDREDDVYDDSEHGTLVLSVLGGYTEGELIGLAYNSDYLLLRSENANSENLFEEIYWAFAAEYADSAGADLINSSLGYNTFDDESDNHSYQQLDGKTTIVTRAAEQAANVGMLVVTSQGNDGDDLWKYLVAPADAQSVLAVGAVNKSREIAKFSSIGPSADRRIKPDVSAMGDGVKIAIANNTFGFGSGTSYAAPLITGLAAGIWQADTTLTAKELRESIKRSASLYFAPDNSLGYGIPDFKRTEVGAKLLSKGNVQIAVSPNIVYDRNPQLFVRQIFGESVADLMVYNLNGVLVAEFSLQLFPGNNMLPFDFTLLPKGMYYVKIFTSGLVSAEKVIVN